MPPSAYNQAVGWSHNGRHWAKIGTFYSIDGIGLFVSGGYLWTWRSQWRDLGGFRNWDQIIASELKIVRDEGRDATERRRGLFLLYRCS